MAVEPRSCESDCRFVGVTTKRQTAVRLDVWAKRQTALRLEAWDKRQSRPGGAAAAVGQAAKPALDRGRLLV